MSESYEREGEWSGYTVTKTRAGWAVDGWSRIQGCRTGYRYLVKPFEGMAHDAELGGDWNEWMTNGEMIAQLAVDRPDKILKKGWTVE